jgi:hypothetical protein
MNKKLHLILSLLLALALLWGCGAQSTGAQDVYHRFDGEVLKEDALAPMSPPAASTPNLDNNSPSVGLPEGRKLIRRVTMEVQTKTLDDLLPALEAQITALGGYLERRELYNGSTASSQWRTAHLTVRIPADKADQFLDTVGNAANVTSLNENLTDVTLDYVATESRIKALQAEGFQAVAATEKSRKLIYDADFSKPTVIIMGAEDTGISKEVLKLCDEQLAIPLIGAIESLNVSAAAAVMLFEVVRQRIG